MRLGCSGLADASSWLAEIAAMPELYEIHEDEDGT